MSEAAAPVLAIDIGGTKTLLGLVRGAECGPTLRIATPTAGQAHAWLDAVAEAAEPWRGSYMAAAIAASGLIADGRWYAVNPAILPVPSGFPLERELERRLGVEVHALNDGQAAAWGEYRFGAGQGCDLVFATVSTGFGGGIVLGGRLLTGHRGLAGHLGQYRAGESVDAPWFEQLVSGSGMAREAAALGHPVDAVELFAAAASGATWAEQILDRAARRIATAFATLQALLDPDCIVVGGGVGLAPGFVARLRGHLARLPDLLRPDLREAALGANAGLLGAADFGERQRNRVGDRR